MSHDDPEIPQRKVLAALGTIGVASAGAGLGTSAYFSDQETFENNQLVAGTLDMGVAYSAHYSDWKPNKNGVEEGEGVDVVMYDGDPDDVGDAEALEEQAPDGYTGLPANDAWLVAVDVFGVSDPVIQSEQGGTDLTEAAEGTEIYVAADVTNNGSETDTQRITLNVLDEDGALEVAEIDFSNQQRDPGESSYVSFNWTVDVPPGDYTLAIRSEDDSARRAFTVT